MRTPKILLAALLLAACSDGEPGSAPGADGGRRGGRLDGAAAADAPRVDAAADAAARDAATVDAPVVPDARGAADAHADARPPGDAAADILAGLRAIPGLTVTERLAARAGDRYFELGYDQPADHDNPAGPHFTQRMTLLHHSASAPTVIVTEGYDITLREYHEELTQLLAANQLTVEHRFFVPSRPEPPDWSLLNIRQAASDHHRIVQALRPLYTGKWLATGASKGGITSVYFRRFFPDDVDATVPYVAPHSTGIADLRYAAFLDQVGPTDCRDKVKALQVRFLSERAAMEQRMMMLAGQSFDTLGLDIAFEHAVIEFRFGFWQYGDASLCAQIPAPTSTLDVLFAYFDQVATLFFYNDSGIESFQPYYYQAATQLGAPGMTEAHLTNLLMHLDTYGPAPYCPPGVALPFDAAAMPDVLSWLQRDGRRFLFIYGSNDPWSAAAFNLGGAQDSLKLFVPEGNHGSGILDLPAADKQLALDALSRWAGVTAQPSGVVTPRRVLEEERRQRYRSGLR